MHAGKHQSFLQGGTTILSGCCLASLDSQSNCRILKSKISHREFDVYMDVLRSRFSANQIVEFIKVWYFKNELWNEIDFLHADKHERFAWV